MSSSDEGKEINLSEKFPDLRPVSGPPSLWTINGIGLMVYGRRDFDPETATYIKTHCLTILFVPIACLSAYRVADAGGGMWYFLGKEPLSTVAKMWNAVVLSLALAIGGGTAWTHYTGTPDYKAGQKLAAADDAAADGRLAEAAKLYAEVATGDTKHAADAAAKLKTIVADRAAEAPLDQALEIYQLAATLQKRGRVQFTGLVESGMALAQRHAQTDPRGALKLLDVLTPLVEDVATIDAAKLAMLEKAVAAEPGDVNLASQLAVIYERQEKFDDCKRLLVPITDELALSEGARVLGQIHSREGELDQARKLLLPYTKGRLKRFHDAEQRWQQTYERLRNDVFDKLNSEKAPGFNYAAYDRLSKAKQIEMVESYVDAQLEDNQQMVDAQDAVMAASSVVPVALDLGVVLLRHSQTLSDPDERKKDLEEAEQTFLAVRSMAGESDEFRLYLGQVYYWLEKQDEARKLFDELLAANGRSFQMLMAVGGTLREVGAEGEARKILEEAYTKGSGQDEKHQAAALRGLTSIDQDDKITWLRRGDQTDMHTRAALELALAGKAREGGDDAAAQQHLRESIKLNDQLGETTATLNNAALCYFELAGITGNDSDFNQGVEMLEKAVALEPSDSILVFNTASALLQSGCLQVLGRKINLKLVKQQASLDRFDFLCQNGADRAKFSDALRANPHFAKALEYLDRVLVLAPQKGDAYGVVANVGSFSNDTRAFSDLLARIERVQLDMGHSVDQMKEHLAGKRDQQYIEMSQQAIKEAQTAMAAARGKDAVTFAVAVNGFVNANSTLLLLGQNVDAEALVRLAEEAYASAPSLGSQSCLETALYCRAQLALARSEPAFAEMVATTGRLLGSGYLIGVALSQPGPLRAAALANADVQRIVKLREQRCENDPDARGPFSWVVLNAAGSAHASEIAGAVRSGRLESFLTEAQVKFALGPASLPAALEVFWAQTVLGNEDAGKAALRKVADNGIPLPFAVE